MSDANWRSLIDRAARNLRKYQATDPDEMSGDCEIEPPPPGRNREAGHAGSADGNRTPAIVRDNGSRLSTSNTPAIRNVTIDRGALARYGIAIPTARRSRVAEEFRIIKRNVLARYAAEKRDGGSGRSRAIMVTSARPDEGKSFTAINLALSIAGEHDLKVLLIDADASRHSIQKMLGISADAGLVDLLADPTIDFADVMLRTNLPNLTVMPAGSVDTNVPELLSSNRTRALFDEMTQRYADRFIIFDAAPCLASSDPAILSELVGQTVFVIEAERTQQEEIEVALNLISPCPNIGLVLNKVRTATTDRFGSYSYY